MKSRLPLLIPPLLLLAIALWRSAAAGPYWVSPIYDPEYPYLLNGLNIAHGVAPWHVDHPGTPLHLLIGAVIAARGTLSSTHPSITLDVLASPEAYLRTAWWVIILILLASHLALGLAVRRLTSSTLCALLAQVSILFSTAALDAAIRVSPEPLLLAISMLIAAALLRGLARASLQEEQHPPRRLAPILGILLGIGITLKITFAPIALVLLAGGRRLKWIALAALAAALTAALCLLPAIPRLGALAEWVAKLFWGSGRYGRGPTTIVDTQAYLPALRMLIVREPALAASIALGAVALFTLLLDRRRHARTIPLLAATTAAQLATLLMVAKMPEPRYLVPAIGLLGATAALAWLRTQSLPRRAGRGLRLALITLFTAAAALQGRAIPRQHAQLAARTADRIAAAEALAALPADAVIITTYGSSSPATALLFAIHWSGNRYAPEIAALHPHHRFELGGGNFQTHERIRPAHLHTPAAQGRLYALLPFAQQLKEFELKPLQRYRTQTLYQIQPPR